MSRPNDRRRAALGLLALGLYAAALTWLSWSVVNEDWDGIKLINNGARFWGLDALDVPLDARRPPLAWLALSPVFAAAWSFGGSAAALKAARVLMPLCAALCVWLWHRFYRERFPAPAAAALAALLALNPMVVQFAPFAAADILASLGVLGFVVAAERWLAKPGAPAWRVLAAASSAAFALKYHLGLLPAAAFAAAAAGRAPLKRLASLAVLPALVWLAGAAVLAALFARDGAHLLEAPSIGLKELWANFAFNVLERKHSSWTLYAQTLYGQLGPALCLLAGVGAWSWAASGEPRRVLWAATLLLPLLALTFLIPNREARYAIPFLPLLYAAVGEGVLRAKDALGDSRLLAVKIAAAGLVLVPWGETFRAARYLATDPSIHTGAPWDLGRRLDELVGSGRCVAWREGDLYFKAADPVYRYEPALVLGAPTFRFFLRSPVVELKAGQVSEDCAAATVVPKWSGESERWSGPDLARVYAGSAESGRALWTVREDAVR